MQDFMISELSIVIPTLNEEYYLPKLLHSLAVQKFPGKLQVIIVDGGSSDKTREKAKSFSQEFDELLILKTHKGQGHQRNLGAIHARYKHLLFLDADIIIPHGMLNKYLKGVDPDKRIVGRILLFSTKCNIWDYLFFNAAYIWIAFHSLFKPIMSGGFLLTTKENHEKIGGFKEEGLMGEDLEYGDRSLASGAECYMKYSCYVFHSSRRSNHMGLFRLLYTYVVTYIYFQRYGIVPNNGKFYYPYGEYKGYY